MSKKITLVLGLILTLLASPIYADWSTSTDKNEMTGEKSTYASSSLVSSTKNYGFSIQ